MKNKKKEIKYERFGGRPSVGGRPGVRAHWAPLNPASATMQFVVYMYFRLSGWRHVYSQSSTQKARVWRMLKVTHPGAAWVRYDLRRRLIFPIVFLKLNTCLMQAQFSDSGAQAATRQSPSRDGLSPWRVTPPQFRNFWTRRYNRQATVLAQIHRAARFCR